MDNCTTCGHQLGIGRFCTNCGQPVPGRHPQAAVPTVPPPPPTVPPAVPTTPATAAPTVVPAATSTVGPTGPPAGAPTIVTPPAGQAPPAARYPLYADAGTPTVPPGAPATPPPGYGYPAPGAPGPRRPRWLVPVVALATLGVIAAIGGVGALVLGGEAAPAAEEKRGVHSAPAGDPTTPTAPTGPTNSPIPTAPSATTPTNPPGATEDLTPLVATVEVPGVAPASTDARTGKRVTFGAKNLTDADPSTAWRVAGDASGGILTIDFGREVELRELGLLNGYAKSYPGYDGYRLNRRVLAVNWIFDDGTEFAQQLNNDRATQVIQVEPVATRSVRIEILGVTAPGKGPLGKDFTAISEITFGGVAA